MKSIMLLIAFAFPLSLTNTVFAEDTTSVKYFPLKVGNQWFYRTNYYPWPWPDTYHKEYITRDTLINGKVYFKLHNSRTWSYKFVRIDSGNGNLLSFSPGNGCGSYPDDKILDSLASSVGDVVLCGIENQHCQSVGAADVFGQPTNTKSFLNGSLVVDKKTYATNFGIINSCGGDPDCGEFSNLKGCVIDGVVYGDTTMTNINQINNSFPQEFRLLQNYPNPFNPNTIINYELRITGDVKLTVYDIHGKEVSTLVNQMQNAGSYKVEFDGSNFASGIYLYKFEAGEFSETKRMVLLK